LTPHQQRHWFQHCTTDKYVSHQHPDGSWLEYVPNIALFHTRIPRQCRLIYETSRPCLEVNTDAVLPTTITFHASTMSTFTSTPSIYSFPIFTTSKDLAPCLPPRKPEKLYVTSYRLNHYWLAVMVPLILKLGKVAIVGSSPVRLWET
jgi:hypothetical protein